MFSRQTFEVAAVGELSQGYSTFTPPASCKGSDASLHEKTLLQFRVDGDLKSLSEQAGLHLSCELELVANSLQNSTAVGSGSLASGGTLSC